MTNLSKTETAILQAAAARPDGTVVIPDSTKSATRQRLLGRFTRDGLISEALEGGPHLLTEAGYRSIGVEPPRKAGEGDAAAFAGKGTKKALVRELLSRPDGATLDELIGATGWLPHTTRAELSRIRGSGQDLIKAGRPDGKTAYRIETVPPAPVAKSRRKRQAREAQAAL